MVQKVNLQQQELHARWHLLHLPRYIIDVIDNTSLNRASVYCFSRIISLNLQAAVYGRDPNWGRIACAAGYAGISFDPNKLRISLGNILLMEGGQPLPFDR